MLQYDTKFIAKFYIAGASFANNRVASDTDRSRLPVCTEFLYFLVSSSGIIVPVPKLSRRRGSEWPLV